MEVADAEGATSGTDAGESVREQIAEPDVPTQVAGALRPDQTVVEVYEALPEGSTQRRQRLYPVLDERGHMVGIVPWSLVLQTQEGPVRLVARVMLDPVALAHPDEILRTVADRMVHQRLGVLPVVERADPSRLVGLLTQFDLLQAREKLLEEERHAERVLTLRRADAVGTAGAD
jgi:CBS domain-containing protein